MATPRHSSPPTVPADSDWVVVVAVAPGLGATRAHYPTSHSPLRSRPLIKLPPGSVIPRGWLRAQLELMRDGLTGRLDEISAFCRPDSGWLDPDGQTGWEEAPYWLRGFGDLGYVLGDARIIASAKKWFDALINSQQPDGWFGPRRNKANHDAWPNMVMLFALRSRQEATGDARVVPMMARYFKYRASLSDAELFPCQWGIGEYNARWWQHVRAADEIESIYWLHDRTGDDFLIELAERVYRLSADWNDNVPSWHGVNIAQGFRSPAVFYQQSGDPRFLDGAMRAYRRVYDLYGQAAGGMFAADENCREGHTDPRQAAEACSMVEIMHSLQYLLTLTGDVAFADKCEDVAFNSLPASMTPDLKALHYLTAPNMVQLDRRTKAPVLQNGGCMLAYSPHRYRCCQHNIAMGWPYFAEHLWMATRDGGLAATLYAESEVTAKVGDGTEVRVVEITDYPFDESVLFRVSTPRTMRFPLALRLPGWCEAPVIAVNGRTQHVQTTPRSYLILDRAWNDGDRIELRLPMSIRLKTWPRNGNAVSVNRGPLTYSLKIEERVVPFDDAEARELFADPEKWPACEVLPASAWNYGLVVDQQDPDSSFQLTARSGPFPAQPFDARTAPVSLIATGIRIPEWQTDQLDLVGKLQASPAYVEAGLQEQITLIPMGCARLRVSVFPTVTDSAEVGQRWISPPDLHKASQVSDEIAAVSDGIEPRGSNDSSAPRFTWRPHRGTTEWISWEFPKPTRVSEVHVYWYDEGDEGDCRAPRSWRLLYRNGQDWTPVVARGSAGTERNRYNRLAFTPILAGELKLEVQLQDGFTAGILEWTIGPLGPR